MFCKKFSQCNAKFKNKYANAWCAKGYNFKLYFDNVGITAENINITTTTAREIFVFRDQSRTPGSAAAIKKTDTSDVQTATYSLEERRHAGRSHPSGSSSYANVRVDTDTDTVGVSEMRPALVEELSSKKFKPTVERDLVPAAPGKFQLHSTIRTPGVD
ncbi:uncharacterized protein LOC129737572 [Uranotaenia lowii]|uniref:uncharacterized protein LOC129737572 n=1 Tax=Uranotaenia lowii TaxID=190385 RepID=UPI002479237C|nr:uncharacterized protein LOC129737572 [Uranotaenia lowii]